MHPLEKTIATAPRNHAARLIYADYLEEHGVVWAPLWRESLRLTPVTHRTAFNQTGWGDGGRSGRMPGDGSGHGTAGTDRGNGVGAGSHFVSEGYFGNGSGRGIKGQPGGNGDGCGNCGDHRGDGGSHPVQSWVFLGAEQTPSM